MKKFLLATACMMAATAPALSDIQPVSELGPYAVTREAADGLATHTVYRPADLSLFEDGEIPVVVWGNGACRAANYGYVSYLTGLAQSGYIIIAFGAPDETDTEGLGDDPAHLTDAIDWLQTDEAQAQFGNKVNAEVIASAGTSCGGVEALLLGADQRIDGVLALNTGFFPEGSETSMSSDIRAVDEISAPVMLAYGGPDDVAAPNAIANYERSTGPFVLVNVIGAGHNGLTYGLLDGGTDIGLLIESIGLSTTWLDYILKGDESALDAIIGEDCVYCSLEGFEVQSKGF